MSRRILVVSAVLLIIGMAVLIYADPLARLAFGTSPTGRAFTSNTTQTFTFNNRTITAGPGGLAGGFVGRATGVNTLGSVATLIAIALISVGVVLEFVVIFLWQDRGNPPVRPASGPEGQ